MHHPPTATMDVQQFNRIVQSYNISSRDASILDACFRTLDASDWEAVVSLILVVMCLADPNTGRRDLVDRLSPLRHHRCANLLVAL